MALDKVAEEIIESAMKEADGLLAEAKAAAAEAAHAAEEQVRLQERDADENTRKLADAMSRKELASAKLEVKRLQLDARKAVLDEVYSRLTEKIASLDEKEKAKIYKQLLSKAEFEPGTVYANARDSELVKRLAGGVPVKKADVLGGLLIENKDRTVRLDYSFDTALDALKEDSLREVSRRLFG